MNDFRSLPDVITTPQLIKPLLNNTSTFVLIQNGVGIELDLQRSMPSATIISACAWIDSTTLDGGRKVYQTDRVSTRGSRHSQGLTRYTRLS
jgi:2-dehydropantoate 2-reductase